MSDTGTKPSPTPFGLMVSARRNELRLSQRRAAAEAGISQSRWRQIENGWEQQGASFREANPTRSTVREIAAVLGLPVDEAFIAAGYEPGSEDPFEVDANKTARVLDLWRRMNAAQRKAVGDVMRSMVNNSTGPDAEPERIAS